MTITCDKWSPVRQAIAGHGKFQRESDSEIACIATTDSWERAKSQAENDINWRVLMLIRTRPGIRPSEIAMVLGVDDSVVFEIADLLSDLGLVGPA